VLTLPTHERRVPAGHAVGERGNHWAATAAPGRIAESSPRSAVRFARARQLTS
jgi:hypothetical protein